MGCCSWWRNGGYVNAFWVFIGDVTPVLEDCNVDNNISNWEEGNQNHAACDWNRIVLLRRYVRNSSVLVPGEKNGEWSSGPQAFRFYLGWTQGKVKKLKSLHFWSTWNSQSHWITWIPSQVNLHLLEYRWRGGPHRWDFERIRSQKKNRGWRSVWR